MRTTDVTTDDHRRLRPFLGIGALVSIPYAAFEFANGDAFEGFFALAIAGVWGWLYFDGANRSGEQIGPIRDLLPIVLFFGLPTLRLVLIGRGWLEQQDASKAAWAFGVAAVSAAVGAFYLAARRRLPPEARI